jgi:hypothetical protein
MTNFRERGFGESTILMAEEAQTVIEQWRVNYNTKRPRSPGDQIHLQ